MCFHKTKTNPKAMNLFLLQPFYYIFKSLLLMANIYRTFAINDNNESNCRTNNFRK